MAAAAALVALLPGAAVAAGALGQPAPPLGKAVPEGLLFGVCLQAVERGAANGGSWKAACLDAFGSLPEQPGAAAQCAKFAGRASEASERGYLGNGSLLCGRLVRERSLATGSPLATYFPAQCVDASLRWTSLMGSSCADYDSNDWCTLARGYGAGWETAWGSFDHYAVEGASADQVCCACGGGRQGDAALAVSFCDALRTEALDACAALADTSRNADAAAHPLRGAAGAAGQPPAFANSALAVAEAAAAAPSLAGLGAAAAAAGGTAAAGNGGIWASLSRLWHGAR